MNQIENKIEHLKKKNTNSIRIMIMGLGSVGNYLLEYLCELQNENIEIIVVGRNRDKLQSDVNIISVAASIRKHFYSKITIAEECDFNEIEDISQCFEKHKPDIIINSSRVYAGLKYGSISWNKFRAYGIWTPLAMKYIKNIMIAHENVNSQAIVINTSYSDATIPWLKSAGQPYPDFGSGNLNHLIPRIRAAVAQLLKIQDHWNIEVTLATGHFHDVVISKEGHPEGIEQLVHVKYGGDNITIPQNELFKLCNISMPTDSKRNMMNASSNLEIIEAIINVIDKNSVIRVHSPGVFGEIGGYPVLLDNRKDIVKVEIDTTYFPLDLMKAKNEESLKLDGIEAIKNGTLYYTDKLLESVRQHFNVRLPKRVMYNEIQEIEEFIIENIIKKNE